MPSSVKTATLVADDLLRIVVVPGSTAPTNVRVDGEIDLGNAADVADVLAEQLTLGRRFVTVDLSGVTFINSAGLRVLALAHNQFLAAGGALVLDRITPRAAKLLAITHLDTALFLAEPAGDHLPARHLTSVTSITAPRR